MKPILSAAEPYLTGNPDQDDDLIQAGIANLLVGIPQITLNNSYRLSLNPSLLVSDGSE